MKARYSCRILTRTGMCTQIFVKLVTIIFHTKLRQSDLFRSQHSRRLVVSSVVVQVVVFLLDDILEVVLGACSLPFDDRKTPQYEIALKSDRPLLSSSYLRSDGQTGKCQQPQLRNF
jgi:hypothetical protein